jgi:hypothetical protein
MLSITTIMSMAIIKYLIAWLVAAATAPLDGCYTFPSSPSLKAH